MNEKELDVIYPRRNGISRNIDKARNQEEQQYKREVQNVYRKTPKNRKKIKRARRLRKGWKYFLVGVSVALAGAGAKTVVKEGKEYKEEAATRILKTVKDEIGADAIYDNSSLMSSVSQRTEIVVEKNGKSYKYISKLLELDGENVLRNELDEDVIEAVQIAAEAQGGNIFDAIKANKYADKIEKGEINLSVGDKTTEKQQDEIDDISR